MIKPDVIWWTYEDGLTLGNILEFCQHLEECIGLIESSSVATAELRKFMDLLITIEWLFTE